ncbi:hypothetical protein BBO99_00008176 [Phytophthora kernoviae]|uniref:Uncharacterized protein n=1 Tax=Phytophthora kernoviae TaxID=325452 RepID=A0A3R7IEY2_9STRA|nr:hypothetical protein BBI17_008664 [Phytophthora kernoviae]RLN75639.1 hypothetical protein BBO99_00008176 [Phytophthora kernoviae]
MIAPKLCFSSMLAAGMLLATANGHGYMTDPAVTFLSSSTDNTQFIATIESSASGFSGTFSGSPADNTAAFTTAFESSSYTSLKELISALATVTVTDATLTCGSCDPDETAQPLPATYVEWSHSDSEGFTSSHEGPCEVWCDDVRVFQDDDCAVDYTSAPAELPYDRDACLGASTLTFFWLALHSSTWQHQHLHDVQQHELDVLYPDLHHSSDDSKLGLNVDNNHDYDYAGYRLIDYHDCTNDGIGVHFHINGVGYYYQCTDYKLDVDGDRKLDDYDWGFRHDFEPVDFDSIHWFHYERRLVGNFDYRYNDFQATTGTVTPSDNTGSGGWRNNNNNNNFNNNGGGWGNGFSFRH